MSKLVFDKPFIGSDGEQYLADGDRGGEQCTLEGDAESIVGQMHDWFADNGYDIEQSEFWLDGKMYECNSVMMHYHYGEGVISFEEMLKEMECVPIY